MTKDFHHGLLDHAADRGLLKKQNRVLARQAPTAESALRTIQTAWADDEAALLKVLRAYQP